MLFSVFYTVSFSGQQNGTATGAFVSSRSEPISLSTLDRDCFIIPIRSLERFLPAGVPVSTSECEKKNSDLFIFFFKFFKASSCGSRNKRSYL